VLGCVGFRDSFEGPHLAISVKLRVPFFEASTTLASDLREVSEAYAACESLPFGE
jgi:hypothetical protein